MRHPTKAGALLEAVLILAGLGLLFEGFLSWSSTYKFTGGAEHAEGAISGIQNHGFTLNIQFTTVQESGMVFSQTAPFFGNQVGQIVPVLYDPENPARASMNKFLPLWYKPIMLAVPGLLFLYLGFRLRSTRNL